MVNWYPTLTTNDTQDMQTVFNFVNVASGGIFFAVILGTIWVILTIGFVFSSKSVFRASTYSSFICSVLSILLVLLNWLNIYYMYFLFFLTAVSLVGVYLSEAYS